MKIAVRSPHTKASPGSSAYLDEWTEGKKVAEATIKYLRQLGHTVYDVTPPQNMSYPAELNYGISEANRLKVDLFLSTHLNKNAGKVDRAIGTEVLVFNTSKPNTEAKRVVNALGDLGWLNRGLKQRTDLGELSRTNMTAFIVEVCFVESKKDADIFKKVGADKVGKVIAEAVANKKVSVPKKRYIATKSLPCGYKGESGRDPQAGLDTEYFGPMFKGMRYYVKSDGKDIWCTTQVCDEKKLEEIKKALGKYFLEYREVK